MTPAPAPRADQDAAGRLLEGWLVAVAARLPSLARTRGAVVAELRDGLHEGLGAHQARWPGPRPGHSGHLGRVRRPRPGRPCLGPRAGRRPRPLGRPHPGPHRSTARGSLDYGIAGQPTVHAPHGCPLAPGGGRGCLAPRPTSPVLGLVLLIGVPTAARSGATTGHLSGGLPAGPRLAPTAAAAAALAGMTVGLALLGMLSAQAFISPRQLAWAPATAAAIASLTRLALAGRATRRCLASRSIVPSG
jgi:hypothetical protein